MKNLRALLGLLLLLSGGPAFAQGLSVDTAWFLKGEHALGEELTVRRDKSIRFARLLPYRLITIDEDVIQQENGKVLAEQGTQFFSMVVAKGAVYCSSDPDKRWGGAPWRSAFVHLCLFDEDIDGTFESSFTKRSEVMHTPLIRGARPADPDVIAPVSYSKIPVEEFAYNFWLNLSWTKKVLSFFIDKEGKGGTFLEDTVRLEREAVPMMLQVPLGTVEVVSFEDKSWTFQIVDVDEDKPFRIFPPTVYFRKYD